MSLDLPRVEETTAWGNPVLKAHGKMWVWWSPYVDAAVFKCDPEAREMLCAADPGTFPMHPHYETSAVILVAGGRIDEGWARARLLSTWREMAPKRFLKDWDAASGGGA